MWVYRIAGMLGSRQIVRVLPIFNQPSCKWYLYCQNLSISQTSTTFNSAIRETLTPPSIPDIRYVFYQKKKCTEYYQFDPPDDKLTAMEEF